MKRNGTYVAQEVIAGANGKSTRQTWRNTSRRRAAGEESARALQDSRERCAIKLPFGYDDGGVSRAWTPAKAHVAVDLPWLSSDQLTAAFEIRHDGAVVETVWATPAGQLVMPINRSPSKYLDDIREEDGLTLPVSVRSSVSPRLPHAGRQTFGPPGPLPKTESEAFEASEERLRVAKAHFETTWLVVDGQLFSACGEPVWLAGHMHRHQPCIRAVTRPSPYWAADHFRGDRLEAAQAWSKHWGGPTETGGVEIVALSPPTNRRIDEVELARFTHSPLFCGDLDEVDRFLDGFGPGAGRVPAAFKQGAPAFDETQTGVYLDALATAFADLPLDAPRPIANIHRAIARWDFERELALAKAATAEGNDLASIARGPTF